MTSKRDSSLTKSEALIDSWKRRKEYKGYDKSKGSSYNSWRAIINTAKGRDAGYPDSWSDYSEFMRDVSGVWAIGRIARRHNQTLPHGRDNTFWAEKGSENVGRLIEIEYNGETKTLIEFAKEFGLNYQGIRQRYFRSKNLTNQEILFGKQKVFRCKRERSQSHRLLRMLGAYRLSDAKKGLVCDITIDHMREIVKNGCVYCGDKEKIGLDRIDNTVGHTKNNTVPSCYACNCARNNNFSYAEMIEIGKSIRKVKESRL
jgi:hypothetical protein